MLELTGPVVVRTAEQFYFTVSFLTQTSRKIQELGVSVSEHIDKTGPMRLQVSGSRR